MRGLPKAPDNSRPRNCWAILVITPIERLTEALYRGDAFDAQSLDDMTTLRRRLDAFGAALDYRLSLVEDK